MTGSGSKRGAPPGVIQSVGQERGQPCPREPDSATERPDMAARAPFSRERQLSAVACRGAPETGVKMRLYFPAGVVF